MRDSTQDESTVACRQQYRTLLEVAEAIVSHRDLQALFHDLAGRLRQVVHFDYLILVLHEAASLLRHQAEASCDRAPRVRFRRVDAQWRSCQLLELRAGK